MSVPCKEGTKTISAIVITSDTFCERPHCRCPLQNQQTTFGVNLRLCCIMNSRKAPVPSDGTMPHHISLPIDKYKYVYVCMYVHIHISETLTHHMLVFLGRWAFGAIAGLANKLVKSWANGINTAMQDIVPFPRMRLLCEPAM